MFALECCTILVLYDLQQQNQVFTLLLAHTDLLTCDVSWERWHDILTPLTWPITIFSRLWNCVRWCWWCCVGCYSNIKALSLYVTPRHIDTPAVYHCRHYEALWLTPLTPALCVIDTVTMSADCCHHVDVDDVTRGFFAAGDDAVSSSPSSSTSLSSSESSSG